MRAHVVLAGALAVVLGLPATGLGAPGSPPPGWTAPRVIPGAPGAGGARPVSPALVVEASGAVAALVGTSDGIVEVARRPARGGAWRATGASVPAESASRPLIAAGGRAAVVAVWRRAGTLLASVRARPSLPWSRPVRLARTGATAVALAAGADGTAVAAWIAGTRVATASWIPARGWVLRAGLGAADPPRTGDQRPVAVAIGADGTATVGWRRAGRTRLVAVRPAGASAFLPAQDLAPPEAAPAPGGQATALVVAADGAVTAAWEDALGVMVADRTPGAPGFGPPVRLWSCVASAGGACATIAAPTLALDGRGRAAAAWGYQEAPETGQPVRAAVRPAPGAAWVDSGDFFGGFFSASAPQVVAGRGLMVAVWGSAGERAGEATVQVAGLAGNIDRWGAARYLFSGAPGGVGAAPGAPVAAESTALAANAAGLVAVSWVAVSVRAGERVARVIGTVGRPRP